MIYSGLNNEYIELINLHTGSLLTLDNTLSYPLLFIWIKSDQADFSYEGNTLNLANNTILCLTSFHKIEIDHLEAARVIKFNREFYCVKDHDSEVSCKGLLFYGANQLPYFQIPEDEIDKFETLWQMFLIEMQSKDSLQLEMLQMMLKRFIILCTRIYKLQQNLFKLETKEIDIVREFHFLVEQHFKQKHTVKEYASLLNKSAKTLANIFSQVSKKSPLQIIHERKLLEAKRMLRYTDKAVKEIAYELGFEDIQSFSRFFKKSEKISPSEFKNSLLGNIANSSGTKT
ncbi:MULTISPECIES: AraC family transcriptional regulator [Flavobacterium]|uniref:AraC family transcriptional regulator n=2 Tax=Flavobacterium TaxID=237 RepID=A0A246GJI1_9FLAO|nr:MULTISPECIES: AraC family transcriptional regulator [Flavobacterium]OWP84464.1 AraC family transcriptional regulator [Flavobacterium davisii]QYS89187.1 helix-turn-helix domain-containing protein [Flavobacterium davisii]RVU90355.1 helix-turn-helix domain-containing protein [Flavobacterium columnare]